MVLFCSTVINASRCKSTIIIIIIILIGRAAFMRRNLKTATDFNGSTFDRLAVKTFYCSETCWVEKIVLYCIYGKLKLKFIGLFLRNTNMIIIFLLAYFFLLLLLPTKINLIIRFVHSSYVLLARTKSMILFGCIFFFIPFSSERLRNLIWFIRNWSLTRAEKCFN